MPYKDKAKQREYQRKWIARRRNEYFSTLGVACYKCASTGELELDHINRKFKIDHKIWSWNPVRIKEELDKCQVLCRNCHALKSIEEQKYPKRKHGTLTMYKKGKCRCIACRLSNSEYESSRRIAVIRVN